MWGSYLDRCSGTLLDLYNAAGWGWSKAKTGYPGDLVEASVIFCFSLCILPCLGPAGKASLLSIRCGGLALIPAEITVQYRRQY